MEMNDEECLKQMVKLMETRLSVTTSFIQDTASGIFTHQFLKIVCGKHEVVSTPQALDTPLQMSNPNPSETTVH